MGLFDRMIGQAINSVASPLINEAGKHIAKQVKDSGIIESTVDDIAYSVTKDTKYAKIMVCPFCNREYDNTLEECPSCGAPVGAAPNKNRKVDYQKINNQDNQNHLLDIGDVITDNRLTLTIIDIKNGYYIVKDDRGGLEVKHKISLIDRAITEGSFYKK